MPSSATSKQMTTPIFAGPSRRTPSCVPGSKSRPILCRREIQPESSERKGMYSPNGTGWRLTYVSPGPGNVALDNGGSARLATGRKRYEEGTHHERGDRDGHATNAGSKTIPLGRRNNNSSREQSARQSYDERGQGCSPDGGVRRERR